jgi:hypothetical protein
MLGVSAQAKGNFQKKVVRLNNNGQNDPDIGLIYENESWQVGQWGCSCRGRVRWTYRFVFVILLMLFYVLSIY